MELGTRLKEIRNAKGVSIYRLSELSGLTADHIRKIERDAKVPTVETISRYLKPLGISLSEFFNEDSELIYATPDEKRIVDLYRYLPKDKAEILMKFIEEFTE